MSCQVESPFRELLKMIWARYQDGLTAPIPLEFYLGGASARVDQGVAKLACGPTEEEVAGEADWFEKLETPTGHVRDDTTPLHRSR